MVPTKTWAVCRPIISLPDTKPYGPIVGVWARKARKLTRKALEIWSVVLYQMRGQKKLRAMGIFGLAGSRMRLSHTIPTESSIAAKSASNIIRKPVVWL
ncbi:hypothetical protein EYC84_007011 [Monilinia fructicola]|uniref:Uncharacterized protein n=1 Tax=Monilinia fructicola TaxID=38448 RepID=A0A5M9K9R1_MONFR|nr:hypothetical protein EYC84_007011 [Monilinia fructicola]